MITPRLRNVDKYKPPYPLNQFPKSFAFALGREVTYHLASRTSRLEGQDWEEIFARLIGAQWKPSNVGLDDIVLGQCAWGAKTVKAPRPGAAQRVRLISGRNGLNYSYNVTNAREHDPKEVGRLVLTIWNDRVAAMWGKYKHLRTTVLIKSDDLLELAVFEFETVRYIPEDYKWAWNSNSNLEGHNKAGEHCFTWQPNGSQFTIVEPVPANRLLIRLKQPPLLDREAYLKAVGFDSSWVKTE